jgi:uncharacterized protein YfbU (UPF0304 family)
MAGLALTDVERLLLANQYEILGLLKKDDDYSRMAENLRDGHKWLYEQQATQISENLLDADVDHVLSILAIYSDLRDSYNQLPDKLEVDEHLVEFPGFDGNSESELLHFSRALSEHGNYSETIGKDARNSHMPTTDMYRRMIAEWMRLGEPRYPLSKDQILNIVQARVHPGTSNDA